MPSKESITEILQVFQRATGILALLIDSCSTIDFSSIRTLGTHELKLVGFDELQSFLKTNRPIADEEPNSFFTFTSRNGFVFIFHVLPENQGAMVAGPMLLNNQACEAAAKSRDASSAAYARKTASAIERVRAKVPVITYARCIDLGKVLVALCHSPMTEGITAEQKACRNVPLQIPREDEEEVTILGSCSEEDVIDFSYDYSQELWNTLRKRDLKGICELLAKFDRFHFDRLVGDNILRSLKNNCICICSKLTQFTIEYGASSEYMLSLAKTFITRVEKLEDADSILSTTKLAIESFAKAFILYQGQGYSTPVNQSLQYMKSHFSEKVTLRELAEYTHLSPTYLSRLIKKETKLTLAENINKLRIAESKYLLMSTKSPIIDVSQKVGFSYQNYFAKHFKHFVGVTPSDFRRAFGTVG